MPDGLDALRCRHPVRDCSRPRFGRVEGMGNERKVALASVVATSALGLAQFLADQHYWTPAPWLLWLLWIAMWVLGTISVLLFLHIGWLKLYPRIEANGGGADLRYAQPSPPINPALAPSEPVEAIERDTALAVALAYAVTGKWDREALWEREGEPIVAVGAALKRFEQLACDGSLHTWGKRHRNLGPHVKIPADYWETHHIRFMDLFRESANATEIASLNQAPQYFDLMVSKAQFEKTWPHQ